LFEALIGAGSSYYLRKKLGGWGTSLDTFAPEALAEYERCFDAATIHASCEDYRAAASIDLVHDDKDYNEGRKVECPLFALWGGRGVMEKSYEVEAVWREYATNVKGKPLDAGHFLAEERHEETTRELRNFLEAQKTA
jgi:haloacetate dehalogenase